VSDNVSSEEFFSDEIRGRFTLGPRAATMKNPWVLENHPKAHIGK
jgi:hypothetical protein